MKRLNIEQFANGLDTTNNPTQLALGYARQAQNLLLNYLKRVRLRNGISRVENSRTANAVILGLYEFINNSGSQFNLKQTNGSLYTFLLTGAAATSIDASHQSTAIPRFTQFLNMWLEADARDANYIGTGTAGYPLQIAAPTTAFTLPLSGTGITGTFLYGYARYSSITGEISPASTQTLSASPSNQTVTFTLTLASTEQFDQIRVYRTKTGTTSPFYELATINAGSPGTYADTVADASLTTLSTIHTTAAASKTDQPVGATDVVIHKNRIHLVGLSGNRSRHRWGQINTFSFENTTDARHDVDPDDGDFLWRAFSWDGTFILMKDHSIHLMNGDANELSFTWQVASNKATGIGCYCPFTAVATPIGIIFQGECGVYVYRPGGKPQRISDSIQTSLEGLDYSRRLLFVGGYDQRNRVYLLAVTPSGQTTNTQIYAYFIDTNRWSLWQYGMGSIEPAAFNTFHNSSSEMKLYLGDSNGYIYENDTTVGNDGVVSGTESGTATGGSDTTVVDSAASFRTTGDGLLGLPATVQSGSSSFESQEISSNNGTTLTTASWTTDPASGNTYYVGAIEGILSLGRNDCGTSGKKRFLRLNFEFQSQSHSVPLLIGFTLDGDTQPTTVSSVTQSGVFQRTVLINRIGNGIAPYIRHIGNNHGFELLRIELDYVLLEQRI